MPDGALLTLVPRQSSLYNLSILSEKSDKSQHKYETLQLTKYGAQSPPMSRAMSPSHQENGVKVRGGGGIIRPGGVWWGL